MARGSALVRRARIAAGPTQTQVAARAGTTQAVIPRIEGGKKEKAALALWQATALSIMPPRRALRRNTP